MVVKHYPETVFYLPDILADWPWKRKINPLYLDAKAESSAWIQSFKAFSPHAQKAFDRCDFDLLAALAYPVERKDVLLAGCDLMNFFFLFDEYTDVASPLEAQQLTTMVMDAMRNPDKPRPKGESVVGEAARQFWQRSMKCASVAAGHRFIEAFDTYTSSVVQEAQDRAQSHIRNLEDYFAVRRSTIGAVPSFTILQFAHDIPNEALEDPIIQRLTVACIDMIILANDLFSYNIEQAHGKDGHNIVTIVMHNKKLGLNAAIEWIGEYHSRLVQDFLEGMESLPFFGTTQVDYEMRRYLDGLGNWVRANEAWSFEGQRYFAATGPQIQRSRVVTLLHRL